MERSIYEFPRIFRRVHMERPGEIENEVRFIKAVWQRHRQSPVRRALDIACGDSPHGRILAREGITMVGVDRSPTMIAAGRAQAADAPIRFYRRNIEKFRLPETPFDSAFFMSETFPIMTGNAELASHLKSVGTLLKRGGIYCIDIDRHDGVKVVRRRELWRERKVTVDSIRVDIREFHRPMAWHAAIQSIYELECTIHFPGRVVITRDIVPVRYTLPPLIELAARASGMFAMAAAYADLSFTVPMEKCFGRWLAVLRRV
ncbi:MAG: class I SAM-dependent DNA methyltransferase [Candidatus Binataceae bacterium]